MRWDPERYLRYSDERALPFQHLVAAVGREIQIAVAIGIAIYGNHKPPWVY